VKAGSDGKRKITCGFKSHINVDEDGLIKSPDNTPGNVHDSSSFTPLLGGDEPAVYADSAYSNEKHGKRLMRHMVENRNVKRVSRNKPLTTQEKQFN